VAADEALLRRLARSSGLRTDEVRRLVQLEVVLVGGEAVRPALLRRLRRIRRLSRDLDLSLDAAIIVIRLLDRIEALEGASRLRRVRVLDDPPR
jgi:MerR HTH family regulatory protein